jgi:hypothetical protein
MKTSLASKLEYVSGHRKNRQEIANEVLEDKNLYVSLIAICFEVNNKNAHKACWILELVSYQKIVWILPQLDFFCAHLKTLQCDSAIRSIAKVCQLLVMAAEKNQLQLSQENKDLLIANCFDWLMRDIKVASKCYAMRTLSILSKETLWIKKELTAIIEKDFYDQSAAFKAVSKAILKVLK